jgi:spore coat protein A
MKNNARGPYPKGDKPDMTNTGQIMAFRVNQPLNNTFPLTTLASTLRPPIMPLIPNKPTRNLILFEGEDRYDRLIAMLGTTTLGALKWDDPITENPMLNDIEQWDIYNLTEDAHPIHLHLVAFQIVDRQRIKATFDEHTGVVSDVKILGQPTPPPANEKGWKDTAIMLPGEVTRILAKFDKEGLYVWHCHILSHEDHEMMRPYYVGTIPAQLRASVKDEAFDLQQNIPNPFADMTTIYFHLPAENNVNITLYDMTGREVKTILNSSKEKGLHSVDLINSDLPSGIYYYKLTADKKSLTKKLMIIN